MQRPSYWRILWGAWVSNLIGVMLTLLVGMLVRANPENSSTLVLSNFILIPMAMGFVGAYFWRGSNSDLLLGSLFAAILALGVAYFLMREGYICILIVSPLVFGFLWLGAFLGQLAFNRGGKLQASVIPTLLLLVVLDARMPHHHHNMVSDQVVIRASPAQVWKYVVQVPPVKDRTGYWLFRLGLPRPVYTTVSAQQVGARRDCVFSGNLVFRERITELEPNRKVTFQVVEQPRHPEIYGHFNVDQGQMILQDNGDGTTTLTGNTWYRLHVYPATYYDLWATDIARNVHFSVMRFIKERAEQDAGARNVPAESR
jgi:hypothetical protein